MRAIKVGDQVKITTLSATHWQAKYFLNKWLPVTEILGDGLSMFYIDNINAVGLSKGPFLILADYDEYELVPVEEMTAFVIMFSVKMSGITQAYFPSSMSIDEVKIELQNRINEGNEEIWQHARKVDSKTIIEQVEEVDHS